MLFHFKSIIGSTTSLPFRQSGFFGSKLVRLKPEVRSNKTKTYLQVKNGSFYDADTFSSVF
jgi:hypothetical protein